MALFNRGRESVPAPRPSFSPKPPAAPKSSFGIFKESLFGSGSTPKKEAAPQTKPQAPGLFGKEGYGKYGSMKEFVKKIPYGKLTLPGTSEKLTLKKKFEIIEDLKKRGKAAGQFFGISDETYRGRILPQIKKDLSAIYRKTGSTESKEYKALDRERQVWEQLRKGGQK